jgi:hypothetical protein
MITSNDEDEGSYTFTLKGFGMKKLIAGDGAAGDEMGRSISIAGNTVVVGAPADDLDKGSAYVFYRDQGGVDNWGQVKKITASDGESSDWFGISVAIDGDTLVAGADSDNFGSNARQGSAHIYYRNQGGSDCWGEVKKIIASDGSWDDRLGGCVSISGDTVVVGEYYGNAAYVFSRDQGGANNWGEVRKLTPSNGAGGYFGLSVAVDGDTIVVEGSLSAYVFYRNQGGADNWGEVKKLTLKDGVGARSVAVAGNTAVVGGYYENPSYNSDIGLAYVFYRDQGGPDNWGKVKEITAGDGEIDDQFAFPYVAISGDTVVVGASYTDIASNFRQGSMYLYMRNHGGADNWGTVTKLTAGDGTAEDYFGFSVGISDNTMVQGARWDDIAANGNQGSAYVCQR